ncbi:AraC family transcriptional regulator [Tamlana sp. 2201CG12-4]|uniref:AraC family transcriptional regulator n=1 Tax=Tamlana sp. 2201CG12-4 TaxID=3112582 RepID=UPI002DB647A5|nr:AraC family transcriptional regulator [Tamlana sp. 2201CG12-4]MEC3908510.1 AraC family transcriptional regulator [Tamlana sp. 2201CG12-4]
MNDLLHHLKFSMLHVGYEKLDNKWNYDNVISPFVRLFLVTKGQAYLHHTNQTFNLETGYMYLVPSYTYNSYGCDAYHEQYYTGFFEEIKFGMSIFNIKQFKFKVKAVQTDIDLFERLIAIHPKKVVTDRNPKSHINNSLYNYNKAGSISLNHDIETQGILAILFSRFIENIDVATRNTIGFKSGDLSKVLVYIGKHIHEEITVKALADYCHLSPDHFTRSFFANYEITPNKYIQLKRIERAQFLLLTTRDSLNQIAERVGMKNISYFSRKFKAITGMSPAQFRKKQLY